MLHQSDFGISMHSGDLRVELVLTRGMTFVNGHNSTLIRPFM